VGVHIHIRVGKLPTGCQFWIFFKFVMNAVLPRANLLKQWCHTLKQVQVRPDNHPLKNTPFAAGNGCESVFESGFFLPFQRKAACRPGHQVCTCTPLSIFFLFFFFF
jgi:hypothetical protein